MQSSMYWSDPWSLEFGQLQKLQKISHQVVHDIRSPLGALRVATQNLSSRPEVSLRVIDRAIRRIEAIVSDLETKEEEREKSSSKMQILNTNYFLAELLEEKQMEFHNMDAGSVRIVYHCPEEPILNLINPTRLGRALSNIINNGVEASQTRPAEIFVEVFQEGENTVIEVTDNGPGLPVEMRDQVTKRGFSHGKKGGKGLGISFAQSVLEEHGGSLEFDWENPKGTTVRLCFC